MKRYSMTLIAMLATVAFAVPRLDRWKVIGPGGGGAQFIPTFSPHDPDTMLVGCDMTGSYITTDAGRSWRMFSLRGRVRFFVFDPKDRSVIYAQSTGLWRSSNGGKSWHLVYPDPASIERVDMGDDHAGEQIVHHAEPGGTVQALAVDPSDSRILYAAFQKQGASSMYVSTDGGQTWNKDGELASGATKIYVDPKSTPDSRTLYVIGTKGVSVREGGKWRQEKQVEDSFADVSAGFPSGCGKPVIYGVSKSSVFVSVDGGVSWTRSPFPGEGAVFPAVAASLQHGENAYVSYGRLRLDGGTWFGVARTTDRGATWKLVWKESRQPAANIHDAWITERFGPGWGENPLNIGVSPNNPEACMGTDYGRTLLTSDGGANWRALYSSKQPDGGFSTTGLDVTTCYGVHFDPFDPKRVFISYTDIGLFRSENGGGSWKSSTAGVPDRWVNTTYWIVFDPEVKGRMWGVMSGIHDLPRPKMWRGRGVANYNGGVCVSDDGGISWRPSVEGMPQTAATHILLDPRSPAAARTLYVAAYGRGVFKSIDGGKQWILKNNGIEGNEPFAWRLAQDPKGTLYLVVARRSDDGRIGDAMDGALYRSTDGAGTWQKMKLPEGTNGPNGLTIDAAKADRLYLSVWGRSNRGQDTGGGIYLSDDGGGTWRRVLSKDQHIYDVTTDPREAKTLYACGFESSAWRSTDRGETWQRIRGYNFKWGHRVIPDPADAKMIYITTFGGSVWHGPAAGDPSALEDIATPALAHR